MFAGLVIVVFLKSNRGGCTPTSSIAYVVCVHTFSNADCCVFSWTTGPTAEMDYKPVVLMWWSVKITKKLKLQNTHAGMQVGTHQLTHKHAQARTQANTHTHNSDYSDILHFNYNVLQPFD